MEKVSNCCNAEMSLEEQDRGICPSCGEHCEPVCALCGGTGEITVDEAVYPDAGSPTAPIGTKKCLCQIEESDGDGLDD